MMKKFNKTASKEMLKMPSSKSASSSSSRDSSVPTSPMSTTCDPITHKVDVPSNLPDLHIYKGPFLQSKSRTEMEVLANTVIGVEHGKIVFIEREILLPEILAERNIDEELMDWIVTEPPKGGFMIPGFVDTHAHAFPYLKAGTDTVDCRGYPHEDCRERNNKKMSRVVDEQLAKTVYKKMLRRSLWNGTTSAVYSTCSSECESRQLARILASNCQRGFVGIELHLDVKKDDVHLMHLAKVQDFVGYMQRLKSDHVTPYLIASHPFPHWISDRIKQMRDQFSLKVKMSGQYLSREEEQWKLEAWVDIGKSSLMYSEKAGMIDNQTLLTHGNYIGMEEIEMISKTAATVVHCPTTDTQNPQHICPVRPLLRAGVNIALGTDCTHSGTVSMLDVIRDTVKVSQTRRTCIHGVQHIHNLYKNNMADFINVHKVTNDDGNPLEPFPCLLDHFWSDEDLEPVSYVEAFYMATLGGAKALGLEDQIGRFDLGKDFDAVMVQTDLVDGPFDLFPETDSKLDIFEKFLALGDDRNIAQVYVAGKQAK